MQHYAFLVSEVEFDAAYGRISERGIEHYADPQRQQPGMINRNDGGRGVFMDPAGHAMELITVPYGGWTLLSTCAERRTPAPGCGAALHRCSCRIC